MDWFRSTIGLKTSNANEEKQNAKPQSVLSDVDSQERAAKLLKAQKMQLSSLKEEYQEVCEEVDIAVESGNKSVARTKLQRKNQLDAEIRLLQGKIQNQEAAQRTITNASSNKEQALLMREGAAELGAIVDETERIDLDEIVDTFQDNAARTHEFSSRLSEPIISNSVYGTNEDGQDIDDELDMLMQRKADAKTADMPNVAPVRSDPKANTLLVPKPSSASPTSTLTKRVAHEQKEKNN